MGLSGDRKVGKSDLCQYFVENMDGIKFKTPEDSSVETILFRLSHLDIEV